MATTEDIKEAVYSEVETVMATFMATDVQTVRSGNHVRPNNDVDDGGFPAFTIESFESGVNRGMGSGVHVHDIRRDANGYIDAIVARRTKDRRFDIGAHTTGDDERALDQLYDTLEAQFIPLVEDVGKDSDTLHTDVESLTLHGTSDVSSPNDAVRGDRFRIDVRYYRFVELTDIPTMKTVDTPVSTIADYDPNRLGTQSLGGSTLGVVEDEDGEAIHFVDIQQT